MAKPRLPNSIRKFLRRQKSEIRRRISDTKESDREITALVEKAVAEYSHEKVAPPK